VAELASTSTLIKLNPSTMIVKLSTNSGHNFVLIRLPFVCEELAVNWEIQAYPNELEDLIDKLSSSQFHNFILQKFKSKCCTAGGTTMNEGKEE
jgi:hypothetical protein